MNSRVQHFCGTRASFFFFFLFFGGGSCCCSCGFLLLLFFPREPSCSLRRTRVRVDFTSCLISCILRLIPYPRCFTSNYKTPRKACALLLGASSDERVKPIHRKRGCRQTSVLIGTKTTRKTRVAYGNSHLFPTLLPDSGMS